MQDIFDYKLLVIDNDKNKIYRPLAEDEILYNLFKVSFIDKLLNEKRNIYFLKYIFLSYQQE